MGKRAWFTVAVAVILASTSTVAMAQDYSVRFSQAYGGGPMLQRPTATQYCIHSKWNQPRRVGTNPHQGTDLLAPQGTSVTAVAKGKIERVTQLAPDNWRVTQSIDGTSLYYNYVHLGNTPRVSEKDEVMPGDLIGHVGTAEKHLHFGVSTNAPLSYGSTVWRSNYPSYSHQSAWRSGKDVDIAVDPWYDSSSRIFSIDFYVSTDIQGMVGCHHRAMQSVTMWHRKAGTGSTFSSASMSRVSTYQWELDFDTFSALYPRGTLVEIVLVGRRNDEECTETNCNRNWAVFPAKYAEPEANPNNHPSPAVYVIEAE